MLCRTTATPADGAFDPTPPGLTAECRRMGVNVNVDVDVDVDVDG